MGVSDGQAEGGRTDADLSTSVAPLSCSTYTTCTKISDTKKWLILDKFP